MTDAELNRLCAEAMGYKGQIGPFVDNRTQPFRVRECFLIMDSLGNIAGEFDPLHDDAQAMALVKRLRLEVSPYGDDQWWVNPQHDDSPEYTGDCYGYGPDLNRAIVECGAKIRNTQNASPAGSAPDGR